MLLVRKVAGAAGACRMNKCGVCQEIVFDKEEALFCDGECTKWHCICVGMSSDQYEIFHDDYDRHNILQCLCDSCKEQNKETTQSEMPITWGKMKDLKKIRKSLDSVYQKIVKWEKKYMQIPRGKAGKTLMTEVTHLIRLFNSSKR